MSGDRVRLSRWTAGGGASVLVLVTALLFQEFFEPGQTGWNMFLIFCLAGSIVAALFLQRFFRAHASEIGEARFDTRNEGERNG